MLIFITIVWVVILFRGNGPEVLLVMLHKNYVCMFVSRSKLKVSKTIFQSAWRNRDVIVWVEVG
jgi:hypothetical protein